MDNLYLGEIILFAGNFAPRATAYCNGQLLAISQNQALFSLLGTTYGGDGRTSFALPDLRGRVPVHPGTGPGLSTRKLGQRSGEETHTLTSLQMPSHTHIPINQASTDQHVLLSTTAGVNEEPAPGDVPAAANYGSGLSGQKVKAFGPATNTVNGQTLSGSAGLTLANTGGSQAHNNMQPWLGVSYIICTNGLFPSRS
jgi:microcystin-dependent protein